MRVAKVRCRRLLAPAPSTRAPHRSASSRGYLPRRNRLHEPRAPAA